MGRIEDLLRLAVKGDKPLMVGRVGLHTGFKLPPGERDVMEKLMLDGAFDVASAQFTNPGVQEKLSGMSQRARGLDPAEKDGERRVWPERNLQAEGWVAVLHGSRVRAAWRESAAPGFLRPP